MALKQIVVENSSRFIALIIGQSGIGKTSLLRSLKEPVCVVSAEAGLLCVRDLVISGQVQGFEVHTFAELGEVYQYLSTSDAKARFKWIFVDSLNEIADSCVAAMKSKYPDKANSFQLWGEYSEKMISLVKAYRDLPEYNVVFVCGDSVEKDDLNRQFVGPLIAGASVKDRLPYLFDEIFYMVSLPDSEGKEKRTFICQPWTKFPGKDRSGLLNVTEAPHLGEIKKKILG